MRSRIAPKYLISAAGWVVTPFNILRKIWPEGVDLGDNVARNNLI